MSPVAGNNTNENLQRQILQPQLHLTVFEKQPSDQLGHQSWFKQTLNLEACVNVKLRYIQQDVTECGECSR